MEAKEILEKLPRVQRLKSKTGATSQSSPQKQPLSFPASIRQCGMSCNSLWGSRQDSRPFSPARDIPSKPERQQHLWSCEYFLECTG